MRDTYSLYEAKAKLSAIIRRVREGGVATITVHGKPVAEIRPLAKEDQNLEDRIRELTERGVLVPGDRSERTIRPVVRRRGALKRFLEERD